MLLVDRAPGVLEESGGHVLVAVDDLPVDAQRGLGAAGAVLEPLVDRLVAPGEQLPFGQLPELGEQALGTVRHESADGGLEPEDVLPQALPIDTRRSDLLKDAAHDARQGAHELALGTALDEHQGKIVTKLREVPVGGEKSRAKSRLRPRDPLVAASLPRSVEADHFSKIRAHRSNPPLGPRA